MAGAALLKIGQGFGTWLIPIIVFGALGFVAVISLIASLCVYARRPRRRITDQEPEMTYEIYRTPTTPYKHPSLDRPVDPTIGRLITHSRSLHVPRNQLINGHRLRPQISSPELRNTSQPPPYTYRAMALPSPHRNPRPHGQVYFDQILDLGYSDRIPQQTQQLTQPPEDLPARPGRCFSFSSPSSYSSTCLSSEGPVSPEAFSPPSTPSIFSQESFAPVRTPSWVYFPDPRNSSHSEFSVVSAVPDSNETEKLPTPRPRRRSETGGRTGLSGRNNRRLIIVDNNLVSGDSEVSPDDVAARVLRRVEVSKLVRGTLRRKADVGVTATNSTSTEEETSKTKEAQVGKPSHVGHKRERSAVFKVICPDTSDLWKMPVIPGETLDGFAGRVKRKTGGDVILFMDDEVLASEEDWKDVKGGGRIVAHLIR